MLAKNFAERLPQPRGGLSTQPPNEVAFEGHDRVLRRSEGHGTGVGDDGARTAPILRVVDSAREPECIEASQHLGHVRSRTILLGRPLGQRDALGTVHQVAQKFRLGQAEFMMRQASIEGLFDLNTGLIEQERKWRWVGRARPRHRHMVNRLTIYPQPRKSARDPQ